jgi:hypothetical protein
MARLIAREGPSRAAGEIEALARTRPARHPQARSGPGRGQ